MKIHIWAKSEYHRFVDVANPSNTDVKHLNRIYVANKGLINPVIGQGVNEFDKVNTTVMYFFSHILNFVMRENNRKSPVRYELYAGRKSKGWKSLT
ncbi:hypothetical protein L0U88_01630 [Flavihumibacter sp. RY-1]|uniref:Uncharacterized protein n=1 Tax=Flavihumibacter fluminis TaxID=2909236 RepID=A0ABS9BD00_9BACT|nr:hypothetical protein [Flavihumibacter fluminis]MCF1713326.1 hypothetical protein [Flavihumibacter fluminis]